MSLKLFFYAMILWAVFSIFQIGAIILAPGPLFPGAEIEKMIVEITEYK